MCSSEKRLLIFFLAWGLLLLLSQAIASADELDISAGSLTSSPVETPLSSSSSETPSTSSPSSEQEPQTPTDAFESLLTEWELFTNEWDKFYPALEALGIGLGELPAYLQSLENSLALERTAREDERKIAIDKAAEQALAIEDRNARIVKLDRCVDILSWTAGGLGLTVIGVLVFHLADAQPP